MFMGKKRDCWAGGSPPLNNARPFRVGLLPGQPALINLVAI